MRRAALVLALALVAALLLLSKRGGFGGRAGRGTTAPEETRAPAPAAATRAESSASGKAQAWRAVGTVNAARGSVEIVISWGDEPDRSTVHGPIIDGRFAIALPVFAEMPAFLRRGASLVARASAPGFVPGESLSVPLADREPGDVPLDVQLEPGVAVRGRVIDETLRPVADAEVWLRPTDGDDCDEVVDETDAAGAFDLPLAEAGTYWLCARRGDLGAVAEGPLQLPLFDRDAGDLVLRRLESLSGVAVYPDGTPVREMQLTAVTAEFRDTGVDHWNQLPFDVPDGLRWGRTTTDHEGRFLIRGLRARTYFFIEDEGKTILGTGTDARLVLDLYRILTRVVDESGAPAPGVRMSATQGDDDDGYRGPVIDLAVQPHELWRIGIGDRLDILPQSVAIQVVPETREYEARLVARPITDLGRVEVRLLDPRGEELPEPRVSLHAPGACILLDEPVNAEGRTRLVPAGDYLLVVEPKDPLALYHPAEARVTVRSGAITPVTLTARGGGRLRLTLKGGVPGDRIRDERITIRPARSEDDFYFVPLRLHGDGDYSIALDWNWGDPTMGLGLYEPGPHELRIAVKGYEPVAVPVHVHAEVVTDAEVSLARAK